VEIPLVSLMRKWRELSFGEASGGTSKALLRAWALLARRPRLYHAAARASAGVLSAIARGRGSLARLPFARAWTRYRDLPAPQGSTFQTQWARRQRKAEP
jgi:L-lactate dehydrogenase complex protein LldF